MKQFIFTAIIFLVYIKSSSLQAQQATIASFSFSCRDTEWDGKREYIVWEEGLTDEFVFVNGKNKSVSIRTVDTLFSYAQEKIAEKLGVKLDKQEVEGDASLSFLGTISGFPQRRVKAVARDNKYDKIIDVYVSAVPEQGAAVQVGNFNKKYQVEMMVQIKVYDQSGREIEKYKKSVKMDEAKKIKQGRGGDKNPLTGNELFNLFVNALNNALESKR